MGQSKNYNTKQKQIILDFIIANQDNPVTVNQISEYCSDIGEPVGMTTIYRQLYRLALSSEVKKINISGVPGACYQYVGADQAADRHFYLVCEGCGQMTDLNCGYINNLYQHISAEHKFAVDSFKTVLYGRCENCAQIAKPDISKRTGDSREAEQPDISEKPKKSRSVGGTDKSKESACAASQLFGNCPGDCGMMQGHDDTQ